MDTWYGKVDNMDILHLVRCGRFSCSYVGMHYAAVITDYVRFRVCSTSESKLMSMYVIEML